MAGSRLEAFGTIFTRTRGLLVSGAVKEHDRPVWYDVYDAFRPHVEPKQFRPVPDKDIRPIFYPEDNVRAKFYHSFGYQSVIDLTNNESGYKSLSQKFVDKYMEIQKTSTESDKLTAKEIFKETEKALQSNGILVKRDHDVKEVTNASAERKQSDIKKDPKISIDISKIME